MNSLLACRVDFFGYGKACYSKVYDILVTRMFTQEVGECHMQMIDRLQDLAAFNVVFTVLDVLVVWYVLYITLTLLHGTKPVQHLKGIFFIIIA